MDNNNLNPSLFPDLDSLAEEKKTIEPKPITASSWLPDKEQPALSKEDMQKEIDKFLEDDLNDDF